MTRTAVTPDLVTHLAALARLALEPAEAARMRAHLERLLEYVEMLQTADVSGVEAATHPLPLEAALRDDAVAPSLPRADLLRGAPVATDAFFLVPKVIAQPGPGSPAR